MIEVFLLFNLFYCRNLNFRERLAMAVFLIVFTLSLVLHNDSFLARPAVWNIASTEAPVIVGVPMVVSLPLSTRRTLLKTTLSPFLYSPGRVSIRITSPTATGYCLPPVAIIANSVIPRPYYTKNLKSKGPIGDLK